MKKFILFLLASNAIAIGAVLSIELTTSFFGLTVLSDYAFVVAMFLWCTAGLFFAYSPNSGTGDDLTDKVTSSMVDSSIANDIDDQRYNTNTKFCIMLVISGVPAFLISFISIEPL